jgi:hypothetical protein
LLKIDTQPSTLFIIITYPALPALFNKLNWAALLLAQAQGQVRQLIYKN